MHKPAAASRRTCSTWHSPLNQQVRFNQEKKQRLHDSATKVMVIEREKYTPTPEPPSSTSSEESQFDFADIDLQASLIYEQSLQKKNHEYYRDAQGLFWVGCQEVAEKNGVQIFVEEERSKQEWPALSRVELDYYIQLFKNKAALESGEHPLDVIYFKARQMLKTMMHEMLLDDKFDQFDSVYYRQKKDIDGDSLEKLLHRCEKILEAKTQLMKIFLMIS